MQYEGEHRQIALRGIERAMANGQTQDGAMEMVVNMIPRNGSYVPYAPKEVSETYAPYMTADVKMIRVHHTSTGDNTIIVYAKFYLVNPSTEQSDVAAFVTSIQNGTVPSFGVATKVQDIVFVGNRMDLETNVGIEHWLWKNGAYQNLDDLHIHENGASVLPTVSFKVSRGIYDGKTVYDSARYVKRHKHYTNETSSTAIEREALKYVKSKDSVGTDALALLDSIRFAGGITGYTLVCAAWRLKGSNVSNPHYVMASPIVLMGAPEIYMKDGVYKQPSVDVNINKPTGMFMTDVYNSAWGSVNETIYKALMDIEDTESRDIKDLDAGEHLMIELESAPVDTLIRQRSVTTEYTPQEHVVITDTNTPIRPTALHTEKYALYNSGSSTEYPDEENRGVRITHGTANMLEYIASAQVAEQYKDEVDCLCIFMSPIISPYKHSDTAGIRVTSDYNGSEATSYNAFKFLRDAMAIGLDDYYMAGSFSPEVKSVDEIKEEIGNIPGLYKVREIHLNDLKTVWTKVNLSEGILSTDRMVQQSDTMLKLSDLQPVGFIHGNIFGYNERLHVYNFQKSEVYRLPYKGQEYWGGDGQYKIYEVEGQVYQYQVEVTDSNGSKIVSNFESACSALNPLLCCADKDAKAIRIVQGHVNNGVYYLAIREFDKTTQGIGSLTRGVTALDLKYIYFEADVVSQAAYEAAFHTDVLTDDSRSFGKNELRVSDTATTLFEVSKSYKIGHGEIIGLARLSISLSQDNFGKYPLVVFCTDGVYMLGVDTSGKYAYGSQAPLSPVVCTNRNGICEIGGAVLFPTEQGLQMVTENGVQPVAIHACGEPRNEPTDYAVANKGLKIYQGAIRYANHSHEKLVNLYDTAVHQPDFRAFVQQSGTKLRYLHALNSVIAYQVNGNYAYMIALDGWIVTKLEQEMYYDNGDYPKQRFYWKRDSETQMRAVEFDYESGEQSAPVLLTTRPMALTTLHLKTSYRVVLRGEFEYKPQESEEKWAGLYVFGSLDGEHWDYLEGKEKKLSGNRFHDMGTETHHVSYKYLMMVFVGELDKDSHVDGLEITSMAKYSNKLK